MALVEQSRYGTVNDGVEDQDIQPMSFSLNASEEESSNSKEDATSSCSSLLSMDGHSEEESFMAMSSLMAVLPIKRGLSRFYEGRSQSFASFSNLGCSTNLAKPKNQYNKKLKLSKGYAGESKALSHNAASRAIGKQHLRSSWHSHSRSKSTVHP